MPTTLRQVPLVKTWSSQLCFESLKSILGEDKTLTIKSSENREFMYSERGTSDRLLDSGVGSSTEIVDMQVADFFSALRGQDGETPKFHYFTSMLDDLAPRLSETHTPGWENFVVDHDPLIKLHPMSAPSYPSIWMGGNGSTTQAHYDVSNNILTQIFGKKRFRLWGPDAHLSLRVFPDAHPRARKAQRIIPNKYDGYRSRRNSSERYELPLPPPVLDVVLEPGDCILIPAFWFHHVEALEESISVNIFSESKMKLAALEILSKSLPSPLLRCVEDKSNINEISNVFSLLANDLASAITLNNKIYKREKCSFLDCMVHSRYDFASERFVMNTMTTSNVVNNPNIIANVKENTKQFLPLFNDLVKSVEKIYTSNAIDPTGSNENVLLDGKIVDEKYLLFFFNFEFIFRTKFCT
eukprot:GSMAST32.ASY1.ANO1.1833.1 assembled CDS